MYRNCKMNVDIKKKKVVLELLSLCNLHCKHCFYMASSKFRSSDFLSKKDVFKLIDKFIENDISKLVLTGGEPTLHPSFVEISKYAMSKTLKVSLCTNGLIPDRNLENKIIALNFSTYTTSIDSHIDKIHDEFRGRNGALQKTIQFLEKLKSKNRNISIHITIHLNNIDHIEDTIEFCKRFSPEIVVSSIYYHRLKINPKIIVKYNKEIKKFKEKYIDDPSLILVGFDPFCRNKSCPDQKNVFMVNQKGELITCYWKKNGGKVIKTFHQLINTKKI
jgi:MoaA/NifB/PqqE/SkfB family radical SAM enzyme